MLLASDGQLKLADFGLAKRFGDPSVPMTPTVVTLFYRAPELLYGARAYSIGVDMWAMGCIFAELMLRTPYLPGESDLSQLETIFRALGTPTDVDWPVRTVGRAMAARPCERDSVLTGGRDGSHAVRAAGGARV